MESAIRKKHTSQEEKRKRSASAFIFVSLAVSTNYWKGLQNGAENFLDFNELAVAC